MVQSEDPFDQPNGFGWQNEVNNELGEYTGRFRSINQPGNQFNENPGGPGTLVVPNQPVQNQTGNNNGIGPPLANATDPDKRKMIQNQLIILIHAAKCQKRADSLDGQVGFYYIFNRSELQFHF